MGFLCVCVWVSVWVSRVDMGENVCVYVCVCNLIGILFHTYLHDMSLISSLYRTDLDTGEVPRCVFPVASSCHLGIVGELDQCPGLIGLSDS